MALAATLSAAGFAQQRSAKRGVCWDEKDVHLNSSHAALMEPGVSWAYNWGNTPKNQDVYSEESLAFAPMCWNANYNEQSIRSYVAAHPETRHLLGFNEPNFQSQSRMTPAEAAAQWPRVEQLASDLGLTLAGPALNFTGEKVGGRTWSPYEWLDEFVRLYPQARMDCLALHCYMNWWSSTIWFATEYFYADLYNPDKKDVYGRYPNLTAWLDAYKEANGRFPRMMLTEFCSWENDGTITGVDFQIDQMTQKVQKLEQSDLVEGYAWFMANGGSGAGAYPYFSLFQSNSSGSGLSDLGKVYVHMSGFDTDKHYAPCERILAKDYVDATTDSQLIRLRPNTEAGSEAPLQIEIPSSGYMKYLIEVPEEGEYAIRLHVNSEADNNLYFYLDGKRDKKVDGKVASTSGSWADRELKATLTPGRHDVMFYNVSATPLLMNEWDFSTASAVEGVFDQGEAGGRPEFFDLNGTPVRDTGVKGAVSYTHLTLPTT